MGTAALAKPGPDEEVRDEYYYGYRTIIEYDREGRPSFSDRPLTLDDFLEPEEGDVYMQGNLHERDVDRLKSIFRHHLRDRGNMTVYSDMKIEWGAEGLPNPAPDISVIADVRDPDRPRGSFSVPEEGVRPLLVLEVVSPRYRRADTDKKPEIYRQAGVSEYIIADPGLRGNKIAYTVRGYRLIGDRYVGISPDSRGRIHSLTTDVRLGVSEAGDRLVITHAQTGEVLLSDEERAAQEKARADQEKSRADSAEEEVRRLRAELEAMGIA